MISKPLYSKYIDYYCPHCDREMYAPMVSTLIDEGGICPWCGGSIRKGEGTKWTTLNDEVMYSSEMSTQHISNILILFEQRNINIDVIEIFKKELKYRGDTKLPYKPYYSKEIEDSL